MQAVGEQDDASQLASFSGESCSGSQRGLWVSQRTSQNQVVLEDRRLASHKVNAYWTYGFDQKPCVKL